MIAARAASASSSVIQRVVAPARREQDVVGFGGGEGLVDDPRERLDAGAPQVASEAPRFGP